MTQVKQPYKCSLNLAKFMGIVPNAMCPRGPLMKDVFCASKLFVEYWFLNAEQRRCFVG